MNVLLANYRYFVSSGPERYLFNITRMLEGAGHRVLPFSVRYSANAQTPCAKYFVAPLGGPDEVYFDQHRRSFKASLRGLSRLFFASDVERAVAHMARETRPDVAYVLCYLRKLSPSLLVGLKKAGVPVVVRLSDFGMLCPEQHCLRGSAPCTLCAGGNLLHSIRHRCVKGSYAISALNALATGYHRLRRYFDLVDLFVTTNPFMQEMMLRAGHSASRLRCIPTFPDIAAFHPAPARIEPQYILYVGRLDPPKGLSVLIKAMALLKRRMGTQTPRLLIAGGGHRTAHVRALRQEVQSGALADRVRFLGPVAPPQIPELMRGALYTVIPALWFENLPNTLLESFACGTPVIASDIGSLRAAITDGVDGLLFPPGDAAELAARMELLALDRTLRDQMSRSGRRAAEDRYSANAHLEKLLGVFRHVIEGKVTEGVVPQ